MAVDFSHRGFCRSYKRNKDLPRDRIPNIVALTWLSLGLVIHVGGYIFLHNKDTSLRRSEIQEILASCPVEILGRKTCTALDHMQPTVTITSPDQVTICPPNTALYTAWTQQTCELAFKRTDFPNLQLACNTMREYQAYCGIRP